MAPLNETVQQEVAVAENETVELTMDQKKERIGTLMSEGRRDLCANQFEEAVSKFGEAAQISVEVYGDFAKEAFGPHFMYGRTMVEMATVEDDMFKTAISKLPLNVTKEEGESSQSADDSMTEEEREEVRDLVADALAEGAEQTEKDTEEDTSEKAVEEEKKEENTEKAAEEKTEKETTEEKTTEEETEKAEEKSEEGKTVEQAEKASEEEKTTEDVVEAEKKDNTDDNATESTEKAEDEEKEEEGEAEGEEEGEEEQEDEEEEPETAQIAWEALEVAAKIAEKQEDNDEWRRKRADVMVQLAQCSLVDEKYTEALEELKRAQDLLLTFTTNGDKLLAEVYFHCGRVHRLNNDFAAAKTSFTQAVECIQARIDTLKNGSGECLSKEIEEDIAEMEALQKDISSRADDSLESEKQKQQMETLKEQTTEAPKVTSTTIVAGDATETTTDSSTNDISGLVRKKRTLEQANGGEMVAETDEATTSPTAAKKARNDEPAIVSEENKGDENIAA